MSNLMPFLLWHQACNDAANAITDMKAAGLHSLCERTQLSHVLLEAGDLTLAVEQLSAITSSLVGHPSIGAAIAGLIKMLEPYNSVREK